MGGCCGEQKVTVMILNVDLKCCKCYRKVKNLLCKFPQIRNQVYDEKQNTVTITVVCCSPERIRDKLCAKGGKTIKSIDIKEPEKPKKPEPEPKPEIQKTDKQKPEKIQNGSKKGPENGPKNGPQSKPPPLTTDHKPDPTTPCRPVPPPQVYPVPVCCDSCYEGIPGGPCYQAGYWYSYGRPPCQPGYGYGYGYRYNAYGSQCDYFSEENPSACSIM